MICLCFKKLNQILKRNVLFQKENENLEKFSTKSFTTLNCLRNCLFSPILAEFLGFKKFATKAYNLPSDFNLLFKSSVSSYKQFDFLNERWVGNFPMNIPKVWWEEIGILRVVLITYVSSSLQRKRGISLERLLCGTVFSISLYLFKHLKNWNMSQKSSWTDL